MAKFSKKKVDATNSFDEDTPEVQEGFRRSTFDNKYLSSIQIKDLHKYISQDCILYMDADRIPFAASSLQEEPYIEVIHKATGKIKEFKNKTDFRGRGRAIGPKSWLGVENLKREAEDKPLLTEDMFEIHPHKRLKFDKVKCLENLKSYIDDQLKILLDQSGCASLVCVIGSGENHRHDLMLPQIYKGGRAPKPILIDEAIAYMTKTYNTIDVNALDCTPREADDYVQQKGFEGYLNYRKTGKFNIMICAEDKDALQGAALLFNPQKKGTIFTHPNPVLINTPDVDIGTIEMYDGECKASGLLQIARQLCTEDSADNYAAYKKFPKEMWPESYADSSFFKEFYPLKTPQEVLSKVVDRFYTFFPEGLKYTAHDGTEMDIDTFTWLSMLFTCVWMLKNFKDKTTLEMLLKKYKVDYSKIVGNNVPKQKELINEEEINKLLSEIKEIMVTYKEEVSDFKKADKKPDLLAKLEKAVEDFKIIEDKMNDFYKEV